LRLRFARLSLLVKILLCTSCAVTLLFGIAMLIISGNISRVMSDNLENEEVRSSFEVYESLLQSRLELLRSVSGFVSKMKEVRIGDLGRRQNHRGRRRWRAVVQDFWGKCHPPSHRSRRQGAGIVGRRLFAVAGRGYGDSPYGLGEISGVHRRRAGRRQVAGFRLLLSERRPANCIRSW